MSQDTDGEAGQRAGIRSVSGSRRLVHQAAVMPHYAVERYVQLPLTAPNVDPLGHEGLAEGREDPSSSSRPTSWWASEELTRQLLRDRFHPHITTVFRNRLGFRRFTPIQLAASSVLCRGPSSFDPLDPSSSDVVLSAPTGQGKTLAYVLPILSSVLKDVAFGSRPAAIVFAPTRELVAQIDRVFRQCSAGTEVTSLLLTASSTAADMATRRPEHILIGTPMRFLEYAGVSQTSSSAAVLQQIEGDYCGVSCDLSWKALRWIVLDEVDRLLEQNFETWVDYLKQIAAAAIVRPRKVLASATMTTNPEKLELLDLDRPLFFVSSDDEASYTIPAELQQYSVLVPASLGPLEPSLLRPVVLTYLLHQLYTAALGRRKRPRAEEAAQWAKNPLKTVVFCNSRQTASALASFLQEYVTTAVPAAGEGLYPSGVDPIPFQSSENKAVAVGTKSQQQLLSVEHFSANLSQKERARLVARFDAADGIDVLVCSDVLARGFDFPSLDVVINYDPPLTSRAYVHRAGRTARAGRSGLCFTLVTPDELKPFRVLLESNVLPSTGNTQLNAPRTLWDRMEPHDVPKLRLKDWILEPKEDRSRYQLRSPFVTLFSKFEFR